MPKIPSPYRPADSLYDEYIPHEICPRCNLILSQDLCVCGWRRPRPARVKRQSEWGLKAMAAVTVAGVIAGLCAYFLNLN